MKLVHKRLTPWISGLCAIALTAVAQTSAQQPEYLQHFDPAKGFRPTQASLTEVFLQIAGSLECYGTPEPYLRHVLSEHERISKKHLHTTGKAMIPCLPGYMTEAYTQQLLSNWNKLSPKLNLDELAKGVGRAMRLSLNGQNGETALVLLLNHHQEVIAQGGELDDLYRALVKVRNEGEATVIAERESKLSQSERNSFKAMLAKPRFAKSDFQTLESFYQDGGPYDRLSEGGKKMIGVRVWAGTNGKTIPTSDAQQNLQKAWGLLDELFGKLEKGGTSQEVRMELKTWMEAMAVNIGRAAQAELKLAVIERSLQE